MQSHRKSNADFNPIVDELTRINMTDETQEIEFKSVNGLLPSNLHSFYTYAGSLTTPPCYQVVNWIVMAERLNMNAKQIEMFRNVYAPPLATHDGAADEHHENEASAAKLILPNIRSIQTLNNRTIMASFSKWGRLESSSIYSNAESIHRRGILFSYCTLAAAAAAAAASALLTAALSIP